MRSRIARAAAVAALSASSVALVLAAFEIGLRLTGHAAIYEMYSKPSLFWRYDELLGWSHEPGARGVFVGPRPWPVEFRGNVAINSLGLRGPEIPARAPGERRVLFLGDSVVVGFEVDYEQTFVARLEGLLHERLGAPVRTIDAGVRGYGTDQSYLYFRERGWHLEPDLVVFHHAANDPVDNTTLHEMRRPFGKAAFSLTPDGRLQLVGAPVEHYPSCTEVVLTHDFQARRVSTPFSSALCAVQMALFDHSALFTYLTLALREDSALLSRLYQFGNPHVEQLDHGAKVEHGGNFEGRLTTALVLALAEEVKRHGARFLVIGLPGQLAQLDLGALAKAGVPVLDFAPIEPDFRALTWHHDSHFNPEGHRRVAELLAPELEALLRAGPPI
jgi:hypothetical protein